MSRLRANSITNKTANGAPTATNGLEVTGVCTATDFSGQAGAAADFPNGLTGTTGTFSGNLNVAGVLTYEDVKNVDSLGVGTFRDGLRVVGICTADEFHGNGANLTGVSGFATVLSTTQGTLENLCFKTPEAFTIGAGTSIRIESDNSSGNTAFTRLGSINVSTGATFHVSAGTTFIMNVLNVF